MFSHSAYYAKSIIDTQNLSFSPIEYSRFKYGDYQVAEIFGSELFEYFKTEIDLLLVFNYYKRVLVYSSPYSVIPTSSFFLTEVFTKELTSYLNESGVDIPVVSAKINRLNTYSTDYGELSAEQRYNLIKQDTYSFIDIPETGDLCIFVDDISITGTHQKVIESLIIENAVKSKNIFLYYAKLLNSRVPANFENILNYAFVNSVEHFIDVFECIEFRYTTRAIKYILSLDRQDFSFFQNHLKNNNLLTDIRRILQLSMDNRYHEMEEYKYNFKLLSEMI